jgi:hypothetical protein
MRMNFCMWGGTIRMPWAESGGWDAKQLTHRPAAVPRIYTPARLLEK